MIVVPTTTAARGLPSHIEISPDGSGLDEMSYAKCEDVKSVSEHRLIARLGTVSAEITFEIGRVLRYLFDL